MTMQTHKLDTSPVILQYGVLYKTNGDVETNADYCVTDLYYYPTLTETATIAYYGMGGERCVVYKNSGTTYMDYWFLMDSQSPRKVINVGSDAIKFTLKMSELDNCYAYLQDTGQIFFAGKNSIYYGYTNINDMPIQKGADV